MRTFAPLVTVLASLTALTAQDPAAAPAAAQAPAADPAIAALAADPAAATALFDKGCARMLAVGSGTFRSDEEQDSAIMRGQHFPGHDQPSVKGGWQGDLLWGETDDDLFVVGNGRMLCKTDGGWKLRGKTLGSGATAPFLFSPAVLFRQLADLPAAQKKIAAVEGGEQSGKKVAILTVTLTDAAAQELALSGALPASGGPMLFALGGGGMAPEKTYTVDLALSIDPATGDVLRLRAKVYEDNPMLANVRFQVNDGNGPDDGDDAKEPAGKSDEAKSGAPVIKKGLPERKPGKTESVSYLKVDFKDLDAGKAPAIDDKAKHWLGGK